MDPLGAARGLEQSQESLLDEILRLGAAPAELPGGEGMQAAAVAGDDLRPSVLIALRHGVEKHAVGGIVHTEHGTSRAGRARGKITGR